jgi:phosphopantothenoylcysteine decarboxylase / phosphopantothenate---cysteine ligase
VEFVKNPDIAYEFGEIKKPHQVSIGFTLETDDVLANAQKKLHSKNFDLGEIRL